MTPEAFTPHENTRVSIVTSLGLALLAIGGKEKEPKIKIIKPPKDITHIIIRQMPRPPFRPKPKGR